MNCKIRRYENQICHQIISHFVVSISICASSCQKKVELLLDQIPTVQKTGAETSQTSDSIYVDATRKMDNNASSNRSYDKGKSGTAADALKPSSVKQEFGVYSKFTFIPGNKLIFYDDFEKDAIGDFPAHWETGGSGEVVKISGSENKWLSIVRRSGYLPSMEQTLPENYTIEFDLITNGYTKDSKSSKLAFLFISKKSYAGGSGGTLADVELLLSRNGFNVRNVSNFGGEVAVRVANSIDREFPEYLNNTVHISMAVNKKRLRMWVNQEKLVDSPNLIQANIGKYFIVEAMDVLPEQGHFVGISNFRIAESTNDLRSQLLKDGKFSTTGIYFDTAAAKVKRQSYGLLSDIATILRDNSEVSLKIVGHTDNQGDEAYNQTLSEQRAAAMRDILVNEFGIAEVRLQFTGKGESDPLADNATENGKANNRRVEFVKI
ncbi:OmpA family protein [Gelidibacter salicanalis]|uniref:OmpA family protein n=1 Tax=Gelidibacter salicanalis TaxID=291193 RepID=A0A5C7AKG4_9FLAO|nr:OmpA family protein [Gelidibacter salicanalis]TXE09058.1 OmpA family protein [Gelidibacter salicanalis]